MGKRANGEGTVFKIKSGPQKGKWKAVVTVGVDAKGKRIRRSRVARTQADATALLKKLRDEAGMGPLDPKTDTLANWLRARLDTFKGSTKAPGSIDSRTRAVELHLIPPLGAVRLDKFTGSHAEALLRIWAEPCWGPKGDKPLGLRSQEIAWTVLSSAFKVAILRGHIKRHPLDGIERPKAPRNEVDPFTDEDIAKIIAAARKERLAALWILGFGTGMRIGEMLGLEWSCVDLPGGKLRVEQSATIVKGKPVLRVTKTKRSRRTIELPSKVVAALHEHRKEMLAEGFAGSSLVFVNERGGIISRNVLRRRGWSTLLKRAKVRYRSIHQMRHSFATHALSEGVPVHIVSAVLGHSQPSTTLNIYSHFLDTHQDRAKTALDRLLGAGGC